MVATFDLFYLLVEQVFGNLFFTFLGLILFFVIMGIFARMSSMTLTMFVGFFIGTWLICYGPTSLIAAITFIVAAFYALSGAVRLWFGGTS